MKVLATILFILASNISSFGQTFKEQKSNSAVCNCLKKPTDCIPAISKRKIVSSDTTIAHHSYCYQVYSFDETQRLVVLTSLCDTKPTDSFYLSFFDSTTLGRKVETWYDTSGRFIYLTESKNGIVKQCYWYHYSPTFKSLDYIIGYREGELFKEVYTRDKYDAGYDKKVIITRKEIRTVIYTDERDEYGYIIEKVTTAPNKTGRIE
jgi:hypothetical protein